MTWKAFINEKMNCKKYETRWPETKKQVAEKGLPIPRDMDAIAKAKLDAIFEKAIGEIKDSVASRAAQAAVEVYSEAKKGGDAGTIARKISEVCIDCMGAGLKKGFSSALKFMREKGA